jgi:hypothetical protein
VKQNGKCHFFLASSLASGLVPLAATVGSSRLYPAGYDGWKGEKGSVTVASTTAPRSQGVHDNVTSVTETTRRSRQAQDIVTAR